MATYQQAGPYLPRSDSEFMSWGMNFAHLIGESPSRYGLTTSDAEVIAGVEAEYREVYNLVQSPATRTPGLVTRKDALRASAAATYRTYAGLIRANLGVDNADKLSLGLHVPDPTRTPIGKPRSAPMLSVVAAYSGVHVLRYCDENTPNSRRKPPGVANLHLWMAVGDAPVNDMREAELLGVFTTSPIHVEHRPEQSAKTASYFARWVTRRGLMGPWSLPRWMVITFGGGADGVDLPTKSGTEAPLKRAA